MKTLNIKSLGINAVLNAFRSSLSIIFPLITYPYVYRILNAESMGKYSYSSAIVGYFILFATFGITTYAVREGAKVKDSPDKLNKIINQLFSINVLFTIFVFSILWILIIFTGIFKDNNNIIMILSLNIIFTTLSADWINIIFEDYFIMTIRSLLVYVISIVMIFLLIKSESDLILYVLINVFTTMVTCVLNRLYCRKYIKLRITINLDFTAHFKPLLYFFVNNLSSSIYVNSDIIMLGILTDDYTVGVYSAAVKIYSVIKNILSALYSASIPRLSSYIGAKQFRVFRKTITNITCVITLFLLPASIGLILLSTNIMVLFGGEEFEQAGSTLRLLSIALIGSIFGGIITSCFNIPLGKEKLNMEATIISSLLNIFLNILLIPIYKQNGAAVTTLLSEYFVMLFCLLNLNNMKRYFNLKKFTIYLMQSIIGSISICILYFMLTQFIDTSTFTFVILLILLTFFIYPLELVVFKNEYFINIIKRKSL